VWNFISDSSTLLSVRTTAPGKSGRGAVANTSAPIDIRPAENVEDLDVHIGISRLSDKHSIETVRLISEFPTVSDRHGHGETSNVRWHSSNIRPAHNSCVGFSEHRHAKVIGSCVCSYTQHTPCVPYRIRMIGSGHGRSQGHEEVGRFFFHSSSEESQGIAS